MVEAPAIRIAAAARPRCPTRPRYDLLCVTSPNGAERLFDRLRDARALAGVHRRRDRPGHRARAARARRSSPTSCPSAPSPRASSRRSPTSPVERALIARAAEGRDVLPDALRARGAEVDVVALYETVAEPLDDATRAAAAGADYVLFTSGLVGALLRAPRAAALDGPRLASIGPATSAELRAHGAEPDLEADPHTPDGLVAALLAETRDDGRSRSSPTTGRATSSSASSTA